ncbi:MAG: class I SAM-dependent methyltransferase [Coleofasciculaceae cyanobacterium SM2_1_6]|nr:class I SAM-dependent methyltransferase [Coleofasciculaceae cyanobacterium SM2_1_6]
MSSTINPTKSSQSAISGQSSNANSSARLMTQLVNGLLAVKPLAALAKHQARSMMIKRAESIGVPWTATVQELGEINWESYLQQVQNPQIQYPDYYLRSFHAYAEGNMSWQAAWEVEVAAKAVHAGIWQDAGKEGDRKLRDSYHQLLLEHIPQAPEIIVDLGCSVGMSTAALQATYPQAQITGVDLSPYFLAVANYNTQQQKTQATNQGGDQTENLENKPANYQVNPQTTQWIHAAAENTGLPSNSCDLVSIFLMCHELPQSATLKIFQEAKRLLRPQGHLAIMDMNPQSPIYAQMAPYIFTLLKSTEPYLDQYFSLDIEAALVQAGFQSPQIIPNTLRHRTIISQLP